ncbi:MAG: cytochrome c [Alphaproteobacteria bacterium]|nr:cytochrome c [Alphaproteobacteria bacterium]
MPSRPVIAVLVTVALIVTGLIFLFGSMDDGGATPRLSPGDADTVARGQEVYRAECAACHGRNLEGQGDWRQRNADGLLPAPPHNPSGHTWHHPDAVLFELTKRGPQAVVGGQYTSAMPAFEGTLSDADILAALSYIKSTWPAEVRVRHDQINDRYDAETR